MALKEDRERIARWLEDVDYEPTEDLDLESEEDDE